MNDVIEELHRVRCVRAWPFGVCAWMSQPALKHTHAQGGQAERKPVQLHSREARLVCVHVRTAIRLASIAVSSQDLPACLVEGSAADRISGRCLVGRDCLLTNSIASQLSTHKCGALQEQLGVLQCCNLEQSLRPGDPAKQLFGQRQCNVSASCCQPG